MFAIIAAIISIALLAYILLHLLVIGPVARRRHERDLAADRVAAARTMVDNVVALNAVRNGSHPTPEPAVRSAKRLYVRHGGVA